METVQLDSKLFDLLVELETNASGEFIVGPLPPEIKYSISAAKQGYIFTSEGGLGHFSAFKLAEVIVTAIDEANNYLPGNNQGRKKYFSFSVQRGLPISFSNFFPDKKSKTIGKKQAERQ